MLAIPRLKNHLHVEFVDDRALLIAEGQSTALSGSVYSAVLRLIDGRRTTDDIVGSLMSKFSPTEIYHALMLLDRNGHIEERFDAVPPSIAAFWNTLGVDTQTVADRVASNEVSVRTFGNVSVARFHAILEAAQIRLARDDAGALQIALVDDYLQDGLEEFNRRALDAGRPWLIIKANGIYSWIGPIFQPGKTGCWACLAQRIRANRDVEEFAKRANNRSEPYPALAALPSAVDIALGMAATEIAKWIVLGPGATLDGKLVSFNTITFETQQHALVRRPQCVACGEADHREPRHPSPMALRSVPKTFVADGGHRAVSPEETLRRYEHHVSPITGVTKWLTSLTEDGDSPVHVYSAGINLAMRYDSFQRLRRGIRSSSCGKGMTDAQARASGLCESIERYCGVFRGEEFRCRSTARRLGERAIDPRECMLYSQQQYRDRDEWNALDRSLDAIPLPFDPGAELDWTPIWSLTRREFRYLPTQYCYYSYPWRADQFYCVPDSNGSAAGNTVEEAILQGFLELVERDCVAVWWYNRLRRPAVDLDSFDEPYIRQIQRHYRRLGFDLWVLDLKSDLDIPAFCAIARRVDRTVEDIIFAPSAHFDARLGVVRALTELNQMLGGVASSKPDGTGYGYDDREANHWWRTATLANQPHLAPAYDREPVRPSSYPRHQTEDLLDDVLRCQSIVENIGLEMLVLDQTRPDIGVPVVKVCVPGLRHFWARFAPGRLYQVPVKMGWIDKPLPENELNPIPIFI